MKDATAVLSGAETWGVVQGDCLAVLQQLPDQCVDAVVTDPPYELGFMGKRWDASGIAYSVPMWKQVLRVLKPGAYLLAFGGTRTSHRMVCAIEDAGAEIRDSLHWLYGSGFPKSLNVSKAIDAVAGAEREVVGEKRSPDGIPYSALHGPRSGRTGGGIMGDACPVTRASEMVTAPTTPAAKQWDGWGTALKPSHEPICLARKPLAGTVAQNVCTHGTGAINVDGCRVGTGADTRRPCGPDSDHAGQFNGTKGGQRGTDDTAGRWPPNAIFTHSAGCERVGVREVVGVNPNAVGRMRNKTGGNYGNDQVGDRAAVDVVTAPTTPAAKQWDGWGTALKPSHEPICLARKPLAGTVAQNVCTHGTGAINVDGCRVAGAVPSTVQGQSSQAGEVYGADQRSLREFDGNPSGRWPPNAIFTHSAGCERVGVREVKAAGGNIPADKSGAKPKDSVAAYGDFGPRGEWKAHGTNGREPVPVYECAPGCPVAALDAQAGNCPGMSGGGKHAPDYGGGMFGGIDCDHTARGDAGGPSRFFPCFEWQDEDNPENWIPCESANCAAPSSSRESKLTDSAPAHVRPSGQPESVARSGASNASVPTAVRSGRTTPETTASTARPSADNLTGGSSGPGVRCAKNPCVSCATDTAQKPAATPPDHGGSADRGWDSTPAHSRPTLSRGHVGAAASPEPSGTMRTTQTPGVLCGCAQPATNTSITEANQEDTGIAPRWPLFYCPKASRAEREMGCEGLPAHTAGEATGGRAEGSAGLDSPRAGAGRTGSGIRCDHPTVKPIELMRWLCRLITPPGGLILDPFCGSGTTLIAAGLEGFRCIGIELDPHYCDIARARTKHCLGGYYGQSQDKPESATVAGPKQRSLF